MLYQTKKMNLTLHRFCLISACAFLLSACANQIYTPKPIDVTKNIERYKKHDLNSPEFQAYLVNHHYSQSQLPIRSWSLTELSLCAYFFHPKLELAKAQLSLAQSELTSAKQRPVLGISGVIEHHSQKNNSTRPWSYGIAIDIPVTDSNKRLARIGRAEHLSEVAKIEIAQTAWQLRSQLRDDLIALQAANQQISILKRELALRKDILNMLNARFAAGLVSNIELQQSRLLTQKSEQSLTLEEAKIPALKAALASSAGLTLAQLEQMQIQDNGFTLTLDKQPIVATQEDALLNRLDIRAGLENYAASEAKLRLAIAQQIPDTMLSPGFLFDQNDRVWSLGIASLLSLLQNNQNQALIAEANVLRDIEAAKFYSLQTSVIGEIETSQSNYYAALTAIDRTDSLQTAEQKYFMQMQEQFKLGLVDRLVLVNAQIALLEAEKNTLSAKLNLQYALAAIENSMQKPINSSELAITKETP